MNGVIKFKRLLFCILCVINIAYAADEIANEITNEITNEIANANNGADELRNLWSIDTDIMSIARQNFGYGIGVNYERKLTDFLSIKSGFGHMVCFTDLRFTDVAAVTVNLQVNVFYYPFSSGLENLYIGWGNGCDFIMYPQDDNTEDDVAISIIPTLGWKWRASRHFMIEPSIGWRFYFYTTDNNENVGNFLDEGFQYGMSFRFFLTRRFLNWISRRETHPHK